MSDVKHLKFPYNVRTRYGMYIGSVETPQVIVREVIDNSIDEIQAYRAANVWIYHDSTDIDRYTVADDGSGLPIKEAFDEEILDNGKIKKTMLGITQAQLAMGTLNAGSKFNKTEIGTGQNGVGSSCFSGETEIAIAYDASGDIQGTCISNLAENWMNKYAISRDIDGELILTKIKRCWITKYVDKLIELNFSDGSYVRCTPDHLFQLNNFNYVEAFRLTPKDILNEDGLYVRYKSEISLNEAIPVFDLEVDNELHNFMLSNGAIVHNCTNALSNEFDVYSKLSKHDLSLAPKHVKKMILEFGDVTPSSYYHLRYEKGLLKTENIVDLMDVDIPSKMKEVLPSTLTTFIPDNTIFKSTKCKIPLTTRYVKYIHPEAHFFINDIEDTSIPTTYDYSFRVRCDNINKDSDTLNPFTEWVVSFGISEKFEETEWDSSVNGLETQSGLHVRALQAAYSKAFEEFFGSCSNRAYMGMNFLNIMLCNEPVFSSQTKERLADVPDYYMWDIPQLVNEFRKVIRKNRDAFYGNWLRIMEYLKSIQNADRISLIKSKVLITADSGSKAQCFVPHKLKDCSCIDRSRAELYVVEGRSASGTLLQARAGMDNVAVLPLRGKPLNAVYQDVNDILENEEMYDLINSIGVGVNEAYSLDEVRYGKIIICADADSDGAQINALVLGALLYHMTFLIEAGYVYIAVTPLYYQDGNYYYPGEEDKVDFSRPLTRFKGLGELRPKQFRDTVLDEDNRILKQVTLGNIEESYALLSNTGARYKLMNKLGLVDAEVKFHASDIVFPTDSEEGVVS